MGRVGARRATFVPLKARLILAVFVPWDLAEVAMAKISTNVSYWVQTSVMEAHASTPMVLTDANVHQVTN